MTRWVGEPPRKLPPDPPDPRNITDDPLAALGLDGVKGKRGWGKDQVYSVSRYVKCMSKLSRDCKCVSYTV